MIHDDRSHTNQNIVFDGAAMYNGIMGDGNIVPDLNGRFLIGSVNTHTILDVHIIANANIGNITPYDSIEPHTAIITNSDIANDGGIIGQETVFANLRK
jgi:hypothetical protein